MGSEATSSEDIFLTSQVAWSTTATFRYTQLLTGLHLLQSIVQFQACRLIIWNQKKKKKRLRK